MLAGHSAHVVPEMSLAEVNSRFSKLIGDKLAVVDSLVKNLEKVACLLKTPKKYLTN